VPLCSKLMFDKCLSDILPSLRTIAATGAQIGLVVAIGTNRGLANVVDSGPNKVANDKGIAPHA
jgi:hypothetical protein